MTSTDLQFLWQQREDTKIAVLERFIYRRECYTANQSYAPKGRLPAVLISSSASSAAGRKNVSRRVSDSVLLARSALSPAREEAPGSREEMRRLWAEQKALTALVPVPE